MAHEMISCNLAGGVWIVHFSGLKSQVSKYLDAAVISSELNTSSF